DGIGVAEGAGLLVLERLSDAQRNGHEVLALVRGSAVNQDGASNGLTAPNGPSQERVIRAALAAAGVAAAEVDAVEAHGTGTTLGDPIEAKALLATYGRERDNGPLWLGSLKSNIGHAQGAAGVAGVIKMVMAMRNGVLPATLHADRRSPHVDWTAGDVELLTESRDWDRAGRPRRAGVSAFGMSGTNAHVVLEEAPPAPQAEPAARAEQVLTLSARSPEALTEAAINLAEYLEAPEAPLADVAYTLQTGRKPFSHRRVVVATGAADAAAELRSVPKPGMTAVAPESAPEVVFMFPGQGAQHPQMTARIYTSEQVFRTELDRCAEILRPVLGVDLRSLIYPDSAADAGEAASRLTQTSIAQPALFAVEYALARLWMSWGVRPAACIGHSVGEYVAACLAGVFSLEDGLRLVAQRAKMMNAMPEGAMLALRLSEPEAQKWTSGDVVLAAANGPALSVLSGPVDQIEQVQRRAEQAQVAAIRLKTSHAFHSPMMEPMLKEFRQFVASLELHKPELPYVSNLTGTWIEASQATDPGYWTEHLRRPVRFAQGIDLLLSGERVLLEVGPGRNLTTLATSNPSCTAGRVVTSLGDPRSAPVEESLLQKAVGQMWLAGVPVDWEALHRPRRGRRVALPTYPFQRQRYWTLDDQAEGAGMSPAWGIQKDPAAWYYAPSWKRVPARAGKPAEGVWLVFDGTDGTAGGLATSAEAEGATVAVVTPSASYEALGGCRYRIDPMAADDYVKVLKDLAAQDLVPDRIAHLWGLTNRGDAASISSGRTGFFSLLYLAQGLGKVGVTSPVKIVVVTDGAHSVIGDEKVTAEKLLIQGPCRVLPQEIRNLSCVHVDLSLPESGQDDGLVEQLVREVASDAEETVVALRGGRRWSQTFEPVRLEEPEAGVRRLTDRGVYLVTGGLGGIGLVLGKWLAQTVSARLVLTARTELPDRSQWQSWLDAHPEQEPVGRGIRRVLELEEAGAEVLVLAADAADEAQMRRAVETAVARFGPINGAIHAAGVAGGGIVQLKTMEAADRVLRPKVDGTRVLFGALRDQPLDFVALCSSMSSVLGGFGQVDYSSANAFLDAIAWENRTSGGPYTISINWNAWREVGMAVETELPETLRNLGGQFGLTDGVLNREGVDAFCRILDRWEEPQVAVSLTDLPDFMKRRWQAPEDVAARNLGPVSIQPRPDLRNPYEEPESDTEKRVSAIWQEVFGYKQIGRTDDFFELGGHSLLAVQLLRPLQDAFDLTLALPALFENSTVEALAKYIDSAMWARIGVPGQRDGGDDGREEITL
ncbi:MAG TPA: SDR family NAD(P)-dependent oxidoreductase, partial [Actinomycetota bacterium]|nr:SDR family NAD(P)-dependent oxidoreductase [Actinomycetota bacterium]